MINVVPTTPDHFEQIKLGERHIGENGNLRRDVTAVTYMFDDRPVAIIGGHMIMEGVMQVWAFISDEVKNFPLTFHKVTLGIARYYMRQLKLRRMQMSVKTTYPEGYKWAKSLGFECEGVMKNYWDNNVDCWLFSRVSHDRT